ncbi:MAG: NADH-quinone oxidoreductase subunit J [Candidatus Sumerlaeia bacterium]|nr:NADH-quinone oxidoreductase subunit J [Candidatus Sumerlaeia bacterium]
MTAEILALTIMLALIATGGSMAAFAHNVLYCIIGLGLALLGSAGLFLHLGTPFVAAMQVLIYIGGISIAMVFAMMLSVSLAKRRQHSVVKWSAASLCGVVFFATAGFLIVTATYPVAEPTTPEMWEVRRIGHAFLTTYNLVFEGLSLVLLLAIIGAVIVAKKEGRKK